MEQRTTNLKGVYFLANNRVLELCIAFLNSFRLYNKDLPLCLIPYDGEYDALEALSGQYGFFIFPDKELLISYDTLSLHFHDKVAGHYRKLAIWNGPFDSFVYIDMDTVVLRDFDFIFQLLSRYDILNASSDIPEARKWVWHDSVFHTTELTREQIAYAANTGFIASKKGLITHAAILEKAMHARTLSAHMNLYCFEQPFLNYLIVTSGKRYNSLYQLHREHQWIPREQWAGEKKGIVRNGKIYFKGRGGAILFLHWAGEWHVYPREQKVIRFLQRLRLMPPVPPATSFLMPYKKLWKYYRFLHQTKHQ